MITLGSCIYIYGSVCAVILFQRQVNLDLPPKYHATDILISPEEDTIFC